ncbi:MAG: aminopeptidase P family protein [Sporichthyaceae bacterium]|nr:aminopeptidase P family protein [Sporichthyaceae bacterium]
MTVRAVSPDRLSHARTAAATAGIDALLVTPGPDLRWLTGYEALPLERLTCLVVPAEGESFLVAPGLEVPAVEASGVPGLGIEVVGWGETEDPYALVADRLATASRVGLANRMWAEQVLRFRAALPAAEQTLASDVLADLRMRKAPDEVDALRRAGQAIDRVHQRMAEFLVPGRSERDAGRLIAAAILEEGHQTVDFVIVGSGPNGASPHHEVGSRVLESGDAVVVDIGGTTPEGYCSDCTRMYALGEPPAEFREYFPVLHAAQLAACAQARPGVTAESVDAAARTVIAEAGFGAAFVHRTGHGIGVETHEDPYIVSGNTTVLEPGMAFSIEPGIYLAGKHGARIEDIVVLTGEGIERLNVTDRDVVGLPA